MPTELSLLGGVYPALTDPMLDFVAALILSPP
jgi:hypothetical protein